MSRDPRRLLLGIVVAVALVCSGCDWLCVAANSAHTGFSVLESSISSNDWSTLHPAWTANVQPSSSTFVPSSVAVSGGTAYVHSETGQLQAYDANGSTNCSGAPATCSPLWTANVDGASGTPTQSDPATDGTTVFVGGHDGKLYAFDARGQTSCSGTPTVCAPLWTAALGSSSYDPVVANGRVFVGTSNGDLDAFDATGSTNCSGTPRTCSPLWKAHTDEAYGGIGNLPAPAVTGSSVYYPGLHSLNAFDPAGQNGCSGAPVTCSPVWTADFGSATTLGWPVVGGSVVYQSILGGPANIMALDAAGVRGCSGTPTVCAPLWMDQASTTNTVTPAIGPDGMLYAGFQSLQRFSTDGTTGCSGVPVVCQALQTASLGNGLTLAPSLADDVVALAVWNPNGPATMNAYRQGTLAPLGSFTLGSGGNQFPGLLAISNGKVFVPTSNGDLQVWTTNG
jgi:putative pyrroloquinoline-quinone-binding quinoprotein